MGRDTVLGGNTAAELPGCPVTLVQALWKIPYMYIKKKKKTLFFVKVVAVKAWGEKVVLKNQ